MRTIVRTGFPLSINGVTYKNNTDDPDELQEQYFMDFIWRLEEILTEEF